MSMRARLFLAACLMLASSSTGIASVIFEEGFDDFHLGARPAGWTFTGCNSNTDIYSTAGYYGAAPPAVKLNDDFDSIVTASFADPNDLNFWLRGTGTQHTSSLLVEEYYSTSWQTLVQVNPIPSVGVTEGPYLLNPLSTRLRFTFDYSLGEGSAGIDDIRLTGPLASPTPTSSPSPSPTAEGYHTPTPSPEPSPSPSPFTTPTPISPTPTPTGLLCQLELGYSTYLGGSGSDRALGAAVDSSGCIYVIGETSSGDFPTLGAYQANYSERIWDVFALKMSSSGSALIYSTYLGGGRSDWAGDACLDDENQLAVVGSTESVDFPTRNPYQPSVAGYADAFALMLSSSGSAVVYSSYVGGSLFDHGRAVDLDGSGRMVAVGDTESADFPTLSPFQNHGGNNDAFVFCLDSSGSALAYSTFLGGTDDDRGDGIAVGTDDCPYLAGRTDSLNFPVANPYQASYAGSFDAFAAKLGSSGSILIYSTFLGGNDTDLGARVALDYGGRLYLTGHTYSSDFPTANPFQSSFGGGYHDAFLTGLSSSGSSLVCSTFFGGNSYEYGCAVAVRPSGEIWLSGYTSSADFPTARSWQSSSAGGFDFFVSLFGSAGGSLSYSTYLGGSANEFFGICTRAGADGIVLVGETDSANFPMRNPYQASISAGDDATLSRLVVVCHETTPTPTPEPSPSPSASPTASPIRTASPSPLASRTATPVPTTSTSPAPTTSPSPTPTSTPTPTCTPIAPEMELSATPHSGDVPLVVSFEATVTGGDQIQYYRWDYNGNGVWDFISPRSSRSSFTYCQPGIYQAICEIEDALGRVARNSVYNIQVGQSSPQTTVTASATPASGSAPLSVSFGGIIESPNQILFYLWDFEGDGFIDSISLVSAVASHIYGAAGTYEARLSVVDNLGLIASDTVNITVSAPSGVPPIADADASPLTGEVPLFVSFTGTGTPVEDIVLYEWDFDGDGAYDWSSQSNGNCTHQYDIAKEYEAVFRVTDTGNLTDKDTVHISTQAPSGLKVWISTPKNGWTIQGNSVTVRANTAPGSLTKWVQPQYKAAGETSWIDMTSPILPPPYSFDCSWNTSSVAPGDYNLRAKASDTSDVIIYSDEVTVTVVATKPEVEETLDAQGNREKRQVASSTTDVGIDIAGGLSLVMPYGSLAEDATVILRGLADNPRATMRTEFLASQDLYSFSQMALEGVSSLQAPAKINIPYNDVDSDGYMDGPSVAENDLQIFRYNDSSGTWQVLPECTVFKDDNYVQTMIMSAGDYALGIQYTAPSPTPAPFPSPSPSCGPKADNDRSAIASGDYNGDGRSDIAVFRPSAGSWSIQNLSRVYFGSSADYPVPGDYNGDGTADIAVFRPSGGFWSLRNITRAYYGASSDLPVPGDYNGDGSSDIGIFREVSGQWLIRNLTRAYFGQTADWPAPADYLGDGTLDFGVFRPLSGGLWAVRDITRFYFGALGDWPVPGNYLGSGPAVPAVFRSYPGMWGLRNLTRYYFGNCQDFPRPADYDGNGTDDIGIFRAPTGFWSASGVTRAFFGAAGDIPVTR